MRILVLAFLLLTSHVGFSQQLSLNKGNLTATNPFSLAVRFNPENTKVIADEDRYLPQEVLNNDKPYISSLRMLGPNDFFMNGMPNNTGSFNQFMLGRTMTQSVTFLGIQSSVRYVFDYNNNLIDHEWSFSLSKKKKKKNSKGITPSWRLNR